MDYLHFILIHMYIISNYKEASNNNGIRTPALSARPETLVTFISQEAVVCAAHARAERNVTLDTRCATHGARMRVLRRHRGFALRAKLAP